MSFKIPRAILALPIWLIDRLRIDERTSRARTFEVRIDIIHMHEETRIRDVRDHRGIEPMFRRHAVKPDRGVTRTDLAMDGLTFRVSMHAAAIEAEGIDQEIVSRLDVLPPGAVHFEQFGDKRLPVLSVSYTAHFRILSIDFFPQDLLSIPTWLMCDRGATLENPFYCIRPDKSVEHE